MSVLVVEDSPSRIKLFRKHLVGLATTNLTTARESIVWLAEHTPYLIFLDFDLDQYGQTLQESGTGFDVAKYIARNAKRFKDTLIIIHSLNEDGAGCMKNILNKAGLESGRMPFIWEDAARMDAVTEKLRKS